MMDSIAARFGRLDALILNASGGLELGADPGYAMRLNRDAQRRLAQLAMPLMPAGGRIVFVTSHQAHFFPHKAVPKGYSAVAASKRAGETALVRDAFGVRPRWIHLTVVSGDMIDGAVIVDHLRRTGMPAVHGFATAIVNAATTAASSSIVYVGGSDMTHDRLTARGRVSRESISDCASWRRVLRAGRRPGS